MNALTLRCDALEAQAAELRVALHSCVPSAVSRPAMQGPPVDSTLLLDPAAARELQRLRSALEAAQEACKAKDEEIAALAFSKESKQGRMLMARVRTLIKENEEFGAQVSEGRLHALETQVEMLKAHVTQLKREHAEMTATAQALAAENEALQLRALGRPPNGGEAGPSAAAGDDHLRGGGGASAMDADAAVHAPDAPAAAPAPDGGDKGNGPEEEAPAERPAKRTRGARK